MITKLGTMRQFRRDSLHHLRLLVLLIGRELKVKYRSSVLGYLWSMLNPLLFMTIITMVFSQLMRGVENYDLYVLAGILFWNMTSMSVIGATHSLVTNAGLLRKVRVPYWIFVVVPIGAAAVNCFLAFVPYVTILFFKGVPVNPEIIWAPLIIALYAMFLAGIGAVLATMNVYFRDVGHVIEPILQLGFYATPVIYDRQNPSFPSWARDLLEFNPLVHFVDIFRASLFSTEFYSHKSALVAIISALISVMGATLVYRRSVAKLSFRI